MPSFQRDESLGRLFGALQSSAVMYLADSGLWTYPGPEEVRLALADLAAAHRGILDRATQVMEAREVPVPKPAYPLSFTGWHDSDLGSMLPRVIRAVRGQTGELEHVATTPDDATAAGLAAESLRINRQHIDVLEQLATKLRAGLAGTSAPPAPAAS